MIATATVARLVAYSRARQIPIAMAVTATCAVLLFVVGKESVSVPSLRSIDNLRLPAAALIPLIMAIATTVHTACKSFEIEATWPFKQISYRVSHLGVLIVVNTAALAVLFATPAGYDFPEAVRNYLGNAGLGLLLAICAGAGRSWMLPTAYTIAATLLGRDQHGALAPWAWMIQPAGNQTAWAIAIGVFAVAVGLYGVFGPRDERGSDEV